MPLPQPYNTGLTEEQIAEAFRRALEDMTDTEIMNLLSGKVDKAEGYNCGAADGIVGKQTTAAMIKALSELWLR